MSERTGKGPPIGRKPSKYRNVRTEYGGRLYDSKAEAGRARVLDLLKSSGLIRDWQPQVTFRLGPDHSYRVDFLVWRPDGTTHAEDVKGADTPAFKRHRKLWAKYAPCELHVIYRRGTEVVPGGTGGGAS